MGKKYYLSGYLQRNKINFVLGIFLGIVKSFMNILFAFLMEIIMNFALSDSLEKLPSMIYLCISTLACYGLVMHAALFFQNRFYRKALSTYKNKVFKLVQNKNLNSFQKKSIGSYLSVLSNDVNSIELNYLENVFKFPEQIFLLVGSLIAMVITNAFFFLCVIISSILPLVATLIFGKRIKQQEHIVSTKNENFFSYIKDMLAGFTVIKSFKVQNEIEKLYEKANCDLEQSKYKKRKMLNYISVASECSGLFVFVVVFLVGSVLVIKRYLSIGVVAAYIQLVNYIINPLSAIPQIISKMSAAKGLMDKTFEIAEDSKSDDGNISITGFHNKILFRDVSYSYGDRKVINNLNLCFEKGKSYAIVGVSGSGKSTILNLLMGYYRDYEGSITIDDNELSNIKSESLYEYMSVMQQDVFVFDADIITNITMHREFSDQKVNFAIEQSGLTKLILEKGVSYQCGENGNRLSGGEKQRISIARSLIRETPILILDEAMSALDNTTARQTEEAILSLSNYTRIVVTHKLDKEMLRKYDAIVMINAGAVAEQGDFNQLMEQKGLFYSLFNVSTMNLDN